MNNRYPDWPEDLNPNNCPVYSYNELVIEAEKETIWKQLINAKGWSSWYSNCKNLKILSHEGPNLQMDTEFKWKTFGVKVKTKVTVFDEAHVLAWEGSGLGARGYHVWILEDHKEGCLVITEETQRGLVPWLLRWLFRWLLHRYHQKWLEGLASSVEARGE